VLFTTFKTACTVRFELLRSKLFEVFCETQRVDFALDLLTQRAAGFGAGKETGHYHGSDFLMALRVGGSPMSFAR
jgi:hypothetical protein